MAQLICNHKCDQKMHKQLFPTQSIQNNICFCEDLVTKPTCWELWFAHVFSHLVNTSCSIVSYGVMLWHVVSRFLPRGLGFSSPEWSWTNNHAALCLTITTLCVSHRILALQNGYWKTATINYCLEAGCPKFVPRLWTGVNSKMQEGHNGARHDVHTND